MISNPVCHSPKLQQVSVCLPADPGIGQGKGKEGSQAVVAPPHQKAVVGTQTGVECLHHKVDDLVSGDDQDGEVDDLDVSLQTTVRQRHIYECIDKIDENIHKHILSEGDQLPNIDRF